MSHKLAFYSKTAQGCALAWRGPRGLPRGCLGWWRLSQFPGGHRTKGMVSGQERPAELLKGELGARLAGRLASLRQIRTILTGTRFASLYNAINLLFDACLSST